ncbi:MAG TPA: fumarate reductase/succinate dehydrogenase flavoprotein subunit, partial [Flavobacteriales bacterium]|nr:fumarate reductase/succinate dehydrogenase flavoprotein subunit [Flavobacteriales bacterium]
DNVGIVRTEDELQKGIEDVEQIKEKYKSIKAQGASQFNPGWHEALGMRNLLITAEAVARAAHLRQESRGAHTRLDYEGERDEWLGINVVIKKGEDGNMVVEKITRSEPDSELYRIAKAELEDLEEEVLKEMETTS